MDEPLLPLHWSRRDVLAVARLAGLAMLGACTGVPRTAISAESAAATPRDFDFLLGRWRVLHRSLRMRSDGEPEWVHSEGECVTQPLLGGSANFDDHVIRSASGGFWGVALRSYVAQPRRWAIWWLDSRDPHRLAPPMLGSFDKGVGVFYGEEMVDGRPTPVRFLWTDIASTRPRWEQAYSRDGGASWGTNWVMEFSRSD